MRLLGLLLLIVTQYASLAAAATIELIPNPNGVQFISIDGEFVAGDDQKFNEIAIPVKEAAVVMGSPGGLVLVGMEIGRTISIKHFATVVPATTSCVSTCALVWLAGQKRLAYPSSKIGFHAAYEMTEGSANVSGPANALVGQYLQQLGLSSQAIYFATKSPPATFTWLTKSDAAKIGLAVEWMEEASAPTPTPETTQQQLEKRNDERLSADTPTNNSGIDERVLSETKTARLSPALPAKEVRDWTILNYSDLPGFDLSGMPLVAETADKCLESCTENSSCTAFTFNEKLRACFLKSRANQAYQFTGAVSGYLATNKVSRVGTDFGPLVDFQTNIGSEIIAPPYLAFRSASADWCQDKCIKEKACKGFNFYPTRDCWLMRAKKPTRRNLRVVSGVRVD